MLNMSLHYDRYGDGLLVTGGNNELLISIADGKEITKCRIFSFDTAQKIAEDIWQNIAEAKHEPLTLVDSLRKELDEAHETARYFRDAYVATAGTAEGEHKLPWETEEA